MFKPKLVKSNLDTTRTRAGEKTNAVCWVHGQRDCVGRVFAVL